MSIPQETVSPHESDACPDKGTHQEPIVLEVNIYLGVSGSTERQLKRTID